MYVCLCVCVFVLNLAAQHRDRRFEATFRTGSGWRSTSRGTKSS